MKRFRIRYSMEQFIDAVDLEQAKDIFDNEIDVYNVSEEPDAEFVGIDSVECIEK